MIFDKSRIRKILCIKPRGIGDVVLSTIILDNLISYFRGVKIDYLTEPFAKPSIEDNPNIHKILTMRKNEFPLWVALRIRKEKYDLLIDLWSNPRTAQITFLSGVKYRVGFAYRGRRYAYNIPATSERGSGHAAEHNLELLKAIDVPIISKNVQYYLSQSTKEYANSIFKNYFKNNEFVVGIIPSCGRESGRCESSKWVEICEGISKDHPNAKFLILWGPGDQDDADYISKHHGEKVIVAPKTDLKQMAGLISLCDLIISNDSGPMHISAALGRHTLGIFGPTDPVGHRPYSPISDYVNKADLFCIKCHKIKCPYGHECMLELPVDLVRSKVASLLRHE
jgi:lipopolysaccharide heptosyltransferase II